MVVIKKGYFLSFVVAAPYKIFGSSLFCMGISIAPLSAGADYMRGVMKDERP